jgi:hypothetical protein
VIGVESSGSEYSGNEEDLTEVGVTPERAYFIELDRRGLRVLTDEELVLVAIVSTLMTVTSEEGGSEGEEIV